MDQPYGYIWRMEQILSARTEKEKLDEAKREAKARLGSK